MPIKFCSEDYFVQDWGSLTSLKSQTRDLRLKVPPGGLVLRFLRPGKNPSITTVFESQSLDLEASKLSRYNNNNNNNNDFLMCMITWTESSFMVWGTSVSCTWGKGGVPWTPPCSLDPHPVICHQLPVSSGPIHFLSCLWRHAIKILCWGGEPITRLPGSRCELISRHGSKLLSRHFYRRPA